MNFTADKEKNTTNRTLTSYCIFPQDYQSGGRDGGKEGEVEGRKERGREEWREGKGIIRVVMVICCDSCRK